MKIIKELYSWISSILIAVVLAVLLSVFVFQPTKVIGSSMEPTLQNQERIYVSKLSHTFRSDVDYGDIVIIDSRVDRNRTLKDDFMENPFYKLVTGEQDQNIWVKRVIGKAGDTLEFKDHKVYRNGQMIDEPYIKEPMQYISDKKIVVPENSVFVMGDNRNNSRDSRFIGSVPADHVLGKKLF